MPSVPLPPRRPQNSSGWSRRGDAAGDAVAGDHLERADGVGREPVGPGHRAEPAPGQVADDADVRRGAGQTGEPVRGARLEDGRPPHARTDAGPALVGVHGELVEGRGADEDRVLHGLRRAVARCSGRATRSPAAAATRTVRLMSCGVAHGDDGDGPDRLGEVAGAGEGGVRLGARQVHGDAGVGEHRDGCGGGGAVVRADRRAEDGHEGCPSSSCPAPSSAHGQEGTRVTPSDTSRDVRSYRGVPRRVCRSARRGRRERDRERGALAERARDRERPAVRVDDRLGDRQPQARRPGIARRVAVDARKNRVVSWDSSSGGMPMPVSATTMSAPARTRSASRRPGRCRPRA